MARRRASARTPSAAARPAASARRPRRSRQRGGNAARLARMGAAQDTDGHAHAEDHNHAATRDGVAVVSVQDGRWSDPETWAGGATPQHGAAVEVQADHTVTYDVDATDLDPLRAVDIYGTLQFDWTRDTHMVVQDVHVRAGGTLRIRGRKRDEALGDDVSAGIEFAPVAGQEPDPEAEDFQHQLGLFSHGGTIDLVGREVDRILELNAEIKEGKSRLKRKGGDRLNRSGWRAGDDVLLPADGYSYEAALGNEVATLDAVKRSRLDFKDRVDHDHAPSGAGEHFEGLRVANLSSNITLSSRDPDNLDQRGQVMIMGGNHGGGHDHSGAAPGRTAIDGVAFRDLGRTDKSRAIGGDNQRGMYALHFHQTGPDAHHSVRNSVVHGSPGWGFVNHGSHVDFEDNVSYNATGAGFVAERGDERGSMKRNLAVGSSGVTDPETAPPPHTFRRLYMNDPDRLNPADLGFHGHGFFVSSPFLKMEDNAAIGNRDSGFLYYGLGLDEESVANRAAEAGPLTTSVPWASLTEDEQEKTGFSAPPRYWRDESEEHSDLVPIMDLPLFHAWENNYAGANHKGLQVRYGRSFNTSVADKFVHEADGRAKGDLTTRPHGLRWESGQQRRPSALYSEDARSQINGFVGMNNGIGLHLGYSSHITFNDLHVEMDDRTTAPANQSRQDGGLTGIENANNNRGNRFEGATVQGYPIGLRTNTEGKGLDEAAEGISYTNVQKKRLALKDKKQRRIRV